MHTPPRRFSQSSKHKQQLTKRRPHTTPSDTGTEPLLTHPQPRRGIGYSKINKAQVLRTKNGIKLIRPAPLPKNLIFQGGGGKGVGYETALVEMDKAGLLKGLEHIVGTSAGALVAMYLAAGNSTKDYEAFSKGFSASALIKTPRNFYTQYPTIEFNNLLGFDGGLAVRLADKVTAYPAAGFLSSLKKPLEPPFARLYRLRDPDMDGDRTGRMVTFKDLELLHRLAPTRFKKLTLTGWDQTARRVVYFNADSSPDLPIAFAGRISMAIPPVFRAVKLDDHVIADGGIGSNAPSEVVTRSNPNDPNTELEGRAREDVVARTVLLTFDEGGDAATQNPGAPLAGAYQKMHGSAESNQVRPSLAKSATGFITGNPDFAQHEQWDKEKVRAQGPNTFVVGHGNLGTFSFVLPGFAGKSAQAREHAQMLMRQQIAQRQAQAYDQDFTDIDDAANSMLQDLSSADKVSILRAGPPEPHNYEGGVKDPQFLLDHTLLARVMDEVAALKAKKAEASFTPAKL